MAYNRLTVNGNTLIFLLQNANERHERTPWIMPLPGTKYPLLYDEVSTTNVISITGKIKCKTGNPYTTTTLARAAVRAVNVDTFVTSCTLDSGTWSSPTYTKDTSVNCWNLPDSGLDILATLVTINEENSDLNTLTITIELMQGGVL
uniref:Uncharacterized protein n=1 Tax=viral metagenome TaxID=1070528 RepID=A0A6M3LV13_9ZZZZ